VALFYLLLEYLLIAKLYIFALFVKAPKVWKTGTRGDVILVQGFAENFIPLKTIADHLNRLGYKIHVIPELNWQFFSIEKGAKILDEYILSHRLKDVVLVSHSKGGLVAKKYIDEAQKDTVKYAITLAAPYHGTLFGYLKVLSLFELNPYSETIQKLLRNEKLNHKIINIYSTFDNHVIPNRNLILEGTRNIQIPIVGHTRILESPKTIAELDNYF
jgi:predicted alpha/beta hydrolase family esterase